MAERGTSTGYLVISFSLVKLLQLRRTKIKYIYSLLVTTTKSLDNIPVNTVFILAFIWHFVPALFPVCARAKRSSDAGVQIEIENALSYKQGPFLHVLSLMPTCIISCIYFINHGHDKVHRDFLCYHRAMGAFLDTKTWPCWVTGNPIAIIYSFPSLTRNVSNLLF